MTKRYAIVRCNETNREVVDSFDTLNEANAMKAEYSLSDNAAKYLLRYPPEDETNPEDWHQRAENR